MSDLSTFTPERGKTRSVAASAGTGKTHAISDLVCRILIEKPEVTIDQFVVITFSRAAAKELRGRIRARIEEKLDTPEFQNHQGLKNALRDYDLAFISTIHEFCARVMQMLGTAGGAVPGQELIEDAAIIRDRAHTDTWLNGYTDRFHVTLANNAGKGPNGVGTNPLLELDYDAASAIAKKVTANPNILLRPSREQTAKTAQDLVDRYADWKSKNKKNVEAPLTITLDQASAPVTARIEFAEEVRQAYQRSLAAAGLVTYDDLLLNLHHALANIDPSVLARLHSEWSVALVDEFQDTDPVQWEILRTLFGAQAGGGTRPDGSGTEGGLLAPSLTMVADPKQAIYSFRGGDLFTYFDAASQDDDPFTLDFNYRADAELVKVICSLMDGFRTDLPATMQFDRALDEETNLIPLPKPRVDSVIVGPINSPAKRSHSRLPGQPPVRLRCLPDPVDIGLTRNWVLKDLADDISRLLKNPPMYIEEVKRQSGLSGASDPSGQAPETEYIDRPLTAKDIAVLVRTNAQAVAVQSALNRQGIKSITGSGNIVSSPGATAWLHLLNALCQPQDMELARFVGLGPFLAITPETMVANPQSTDLKISAQLAEFGKLISAGNIPGIITTVNTTADPLSARLARTQGGERLLTDLTHMAELLQQYAAETEFNVVSLRDWLVEQRSLKADDITATRRLETDDDAVTIQTIHKSKGLEYPVVYLPFLWENPAGKGGLPVFHNPDDELAKYLAATGVVPKPNAKTPRVLHADPDADDVPQRGRVVDIGGEAQGMTTARGDVIFWRSHLAKIETEAEAGRLMYVALTRASSQVVAWYVPPVDESDGDGTKKPAPLSPFQALMGSYFKKFSPAEFAALHPEPSDDIDIEQFVEIELGIAGLSIAATGSATSSDKPQSVNLQAAEFPITAGSTWVRTSYSALSDNRKKAVLADGGSADAEISVPELDEEGEEFDSEDQISSDESVVEPPLDAPKLPPDSPLAKSAPFRNFAPGKEFGTAVHELLELVNTDVKDLTAELTNQAAAALGLPVDDPAVTDLGENLALVAATPLGPLAANLSLAQIRKEDQLHEFSFEFPFAGGDSPNSSAIRIKEFLPQLIVTLKQHDDAGSQLLVPYFEDLLKSNTAATEIRGYLNGEIDLLFRVKRPNEDHYRYLVADYKTNFLGDFNNISADVIGNYQPQAMADSMVHHGYTLQALIYYTALHRYLRWRIGADYLENPGKYLGGVLYLYLRGMAGVPDGANAGEHPPTGVFEWTPPVELIIEFSNFLDGSNPKNYSKEGA